MDKEYVFYTRFSSDMQRPESCEDQEREIRAGLAKLGVTCARPLVIKDQAVSGTQSGRDGFTKLMDLVHAGRVRLLVVDDQSRLSRADHAFMLINDVVFFGGRFISTGEGIDTNQEGWELRVRVMELHNSTTIRELGRRVRRGQKGRVLDQNGAAGDHCFGYRSEYVDPNWAEALAARGPKPKKIVVIYEPEATVVRMIFTLFVAGWSINAIVRKLNAEKVPKGHRCSKPDWCHYHVRRILGNAKYVGHWVWGTTVTVRDSRGRKRQVPSTADQIATVERPDLRIIDDKTWEKVQTLLKKLDDVYGKKPNQKSRVARVHHTELYPASLLGGLVFCSACGARMTIQFGSAQKYLGCPNHRKGTCLMAVRVPMNRAEKAVVDLLGTVLTLDADWTSAAIAFMRRTLVEVSTAVPEFLAADEKQLR
ncbi:MAG TPA: recombinase family protein, partial [Phycisphaerae bacterium]|nr:recombinase family protein [Phycisphaerae bacterium]